MSYLKQTGIEPCFRKKKDDYYFMKLFLDVLSRNLERHAQSKPNIKLRSL